MKPIDFIQYFEKGEALLGMSRIILTIRIRRRKNTIENEDAPKREVLDNAFVTGETVAGISLNQIHTVTKVLSNHEKARRGYGLPIRICCVKPCKLTFRCVLTICVFCSTGLKTTI
jgi:hypothetical protein